jgi:hypothetical protein
LSADDVNRDHKHAKSRGAEFTMPPTEGMLSLTIAVLNDTCGNLIQITQLARK